ncbi:unnamed protein product, partial [Amoebophrya sp. A25]
LHTHSPASVELGIFNETAPAKHVTEIIFLQDPFSSLTWYLVLSSFYVIQF